jgi:hypothetical protein
MQDLGEFARVYTSYPKYSTLRVFGLTIAETLKHQEIYNLLAKNLDRRQVRCDLWRSTNIVAMTRLQRTDGIKFHGIVLRCEVLTIINNKYYYYENSNRI